MVEPEYIRIHKKYFSSEFIQAYNLTPKIAADNYVYCQVKKGMYSLKQAAILAYKLLVKRLERHGYYVISLTNGFFCTQTPPYKIRTLC